MTKPTSWCIDIRQEHPLMDKFKEWFKKSAKFYNKYLTWIYYGFMRPWQQMWFARGDTMGSSIITLDQRRERRGKEYYETRK